jgi:hypothetical protein
VSKILFEMENNLYLIQFKVEGEVRTRGDGDEDDGDNNYLGKGYDTREEDIDHEMDSCSNKTPSEKREGKNDTNQVRTTPIKF